MSGGGGLHVNVGRDIRTCRAITTKSVEIEPKKQELFSKLISQLRAKSECVVAEHIYTIYTMEQFNY